MVDLAEKDVSFHIYVILVDWGRVQASGIPFWIRNRESLTFIAFDFLMKQRERRGILSLAHGSQ